MTLTHVCNTPWADAAQVESGWFPPRNDGLSEFGEKIVREMNRLGMLVDLSHVSSDTMRQVMAVTVAPVIFSHSGAREICSNPRNVPDDVLRLVKEVCCTRILFLSGGIFLFSIISVTFNLQGI